MTLPLYVYLWWKPPVHVWKYVRFRAFLVRAQRFGTAAQANAGAEYISNRL
jgi:hypothetical protein